MLQIHKQTSRPTEWDEFFSIPKMPIETLYDRWRDQNHDEYKTVKRTLLTEQNFVCAYCEQRINFEKSQIEHLVPKAENSELVFCYYNLVAVCSGRSSDGSENFCDNHRGIKPVIGLGFYHKLLDPTQRLQNLLTVSNKGEFRFNSSDDPLQPIFENFIGSLNLNAPFLKERRTEILAGLDELVPPIRTDSLDSSLLSTGIRNCRNKLNKLTQHHGAEFRTAQILYLQRKIMRLETKQQKQNT